MFVFLKAFIHNSAATCYWQATAEVMMKSRRFLYRQNKRRALQLKATSVFN
jgi:hypothetical protein